MSALPNFYLEEVCITGFWGSRTVSAKLHRDINFIIGANGTGKTTFVNYIAAALSGDIRSLLKANFKDITIKLKKPNEDERVEIVITKLAAESKIGKITYEFIKGENRDLVEIEGSPRTGYYQLESGRRIRQHNRFEPTIKAKLKELMKVKWLSIHRTPDPIELDESDFEDYDSTVDRKVKQVLAGIRGYYTRLKTKTENDQTEFQKKIFLSLFDHLGTDQHTATNVKKLDLAKERNQLIEIFKQFGLENNSYQSNLDKHFGDINDIINKGRKTGRKKAADELMYFGMNRIHNVVQQWQETSRLKQEHLRPITNFLELLRSQFVNKKISVDETNDLSFTGHDDIEIPDGELSSGEKQLLILMGEALLQEHMPWIYIADEPELSLHITWQESLIKNLATLNPNTQLIIATHSPDIVSQYSAKVFDMAEISK